MENEIQYQIPNAVIEPQPANNQKKYMLFGGVILLIIILSVSVFLLNHKQTKTSTTPVQNSSSVTKADVSFYPPSVLLSSTVPTKTVEILLSAPLSSTGVELEMVYDPQALKDVSFLTPAKTFFGDQTQYKVLKKTIDTQHGVMYFSIGGMPSSTIASTKGVVAYLTFTRNPTFTKTSSVIAFLNTSMVTQKGSHDSILTNAKPLEISIMP